jgi:hypothetical protein
MARPIKYEERFDYMAEVACREGGFTDWKLGRLFDVSISTITNWKRNYSSFSDAVKRGKDDFDTMAVEESLLKQCFGYTFTEKTMEPNKDGELKIIKVVEKHTPANVTATKFFLKNRGPQRWRDRQQFEHSGPDGGPIEQEIKIDADISLTEAQALYEKIVSEE